MTFAQIPIAQAQKVLQSVTETSGPGTVIKVMAREIERLHEENAQLHAAIAMYRAAYERAARKLHDVIVNPQPQT
jgi:hypothetical protein